MKAFDFCAVKKCAYDLIDSCKNRSLAPYIISGIRGAFRFKSDADIAERYVIFFAGNFKRQCLPLVHTAPFPA